MKKGLTSSYYVFIATGFLLSLAVGGCSNVETEAKYPTGYDRSATAGDIYAKPKSVLGGEGGGLLGGRDDSKDSQAAIGVNSYLWRASLDTVSFMPLASVDPFGGVILTDWYTDPALPNERMKLNVFILGRELRSDGIRVRAFRQVKDGSAWKDASVVEGTERKLEDSILTRARQLRVAGLRDES